MRSIGVLFVHGIGTQARGRTLADWGDAITSWIDRWLPSDARHRIEIREAFLTPDSPSEPPYAVVDLFTAGEAAPSTLLLAESWWAETVLPPTYAELVRWSLLVVPWTLASHFLSRLRASSGRVAALLWNFVTMLVALLAMPALLAVLAVVLILGLIPIAQVRQIAVAIQRTLATTIGDSFALLHNDIQRAAIVARVERDLSWIAGKCDETVIVAHSQGAAVAHMVLSKTTLDRDAIMLVTFGSGIGRLREAEQLTRGGFQRKAVPWIFCLGGMLAAIGLWRSLPGFWELRWELARAVAIYLGIVAVFSFFASKLPQWVVLTGTLLAFVPIVPVMFSLFDKSPMVFFLIGAQYAIGLGFAWAEDGSSVQPFEAKVSRWLDLYASRDPVSNGPLFGQKGRRRSIEVCNQRSIISDHTTYWKSTDDFVARIACLLAAKTGVSLDRCVAGDRLRLSRARARRRWRTAWLAAVRAAVVVSPLLIVGTLGLSSAFIAVDAGPLFSVQRNSTEFIGELVSAVTPDFVKAEMSYPPAQFPTSPAVLRTSSLTLLLLLTGAAFLLITWRWRAWDETEVTRLFRRQNVALLEPQFVVFLLVTVAILELIAFAAMGWLAALRYASPEILTALGAAVLKVAAMGAFPWVIFLIAFVVGRTPVAQRIRRAAAAGAVAALIALPFFVWAALQPSAGGSPESSDWIRLEQESTIALSVIAVVWLIPASRLWRFLEPKLAPRAFASLIFLVVVTVPVEMRATMGSSTAQAGATRDIERRFLSGVSAESISTMHRQVTEHPHIAGSARSMEVADRVRRALDGAGLQTEVREYLVHLSTPGSIRVDIISPTAESLVVREPASPEDPDTAHAELGPAFVAYSGSGTVTAPVVYANYGLPPDYARLAAAGVDVRGKIVIARYARSHRAVKLHTAEKAGAAGIIIYSDPADDGYARGLPWPEGPWRADFQSQSGNGKYSWFWHGDPLTPGVAATAGAPTLDPAAAPTLPKIPAVVLSAKEAAKILSRLAGPAVPSGSGFQGALPFTYRLGPGPVTVRLDVQMNASRRPIRNVIGKITGRDPDRWIVLGTHHDAWSFGGMDPGTGLSPTFEVARGLAALARSGWTPERSIVFAFWDAEEFGLIGSTEYAEAMQRELREKAIVYINTDLSMRGRFDGGGTPSLRDFLVQVTRDVPHFDGSGSVYDRWRTDEWQRQPLERRRRGEDGFEVELAALGSGADFVAFQDFLGLPTLQMEFDFEGSYGPYHSNYDTRRFVERHTDPNFTVSQTLARVLGLAVLRLASTNVLPFRYSHYARKMEEFIDGAEVWAVDDQGRARVATDLATARRLAVLARVKAESIEAQLDRRVAAGPVDPRNARPINDALVKLEQQLLDESEPPETRWYRHVIYGWNIYSLYEGQPLPGLAEAIRLGDATAVARETARLERALTRFGTALDDIARLADALIAR